LFGGIRPSLLEGIQIAHSDVQFQKNNITKIIINPNQKIHHRSGTFFYFQQSIFSILLNTLTISSMPKILTLTIFCALLLNGCTIEKKRYSSGYHTSWNVQHLFPKGNNANQFQKEESKLSFSPKLNSQNDNALRPTSSDSIQKQESGKQAQLSIDSKHKKQHQTTSISDTVPETKKNESKMQNTVELFDQLQQDRRSIRFSWLSLLASLVVFIGGFAIWWQTESALSEALLSLGFLGLIASLILIIAFTILKNKHIKQSPQYYKKKNKDLTQFNTPQNPEVHAAQLAELNKEIKKDNIIRFIFLLPSILTLTYLFPIGLACLITFIVYTFQRKRLIVERNEMMNNETKTNPPAQTKSFIDFSVKRTFK